MNKSQGNGGVQRGAKGRSPAAQPPDEPAVSVASTDGAAGQGRGAGSRRQVGIREIARLADVSVATVSMVLNNNPKISEPTRKKVARIISQVGYRPNRLAQSLSGRYTRLISILLPALRHTLADPYFGELISGISDKAARLGHKIMLEQAKPDFIRERRHMELFERRFVDGVLCIGFEDRHTFLADFVGGDHPAMLVNNTISDLEMDHVVCDYTSGAEQVMTYLAQLGHRRIGLIHGSEDVRTMHAMVEVYRRRIAEINGSLDESMVVDGLFTEEHGATATDALLDRHPGITAIFACNDKMALGALHTISRRGLSVPGDVSVVGSDNIQYAKFVNPSLTTVSTPLYEAGALACERLIDRIRGKVKTVAEVLPTHLVLRESTGMARSS